MRTMRSRLSLAAAAFAVALLVASVAFVRAQATTGLTGNITVSSQFSQVATIDLGSGSYPLAKVYTTLFSTGSGANQANKLFSDQRTLSASASEDLDLNGSLTDAFGQTLTFTKVRGVIISAAAGNTNNVIVGNASANGAALFFGATTHTATIRPGGMLAVTAPDSTAYGVTAGTGDLLHVANSGAGTAVTYDVIVIGS